MFFKCSYLGNKAHLAQIRFFRLPESLPYSGFLQRVVFTTSSKGEIELWYLFLVGRRWFFLLWWSCFVLKKKRVYKFCISSTVQRSFRFFPFLHCFLPCKSFTRRKYSSDWKSTGEDGRHQDTPSEEFQLTANTLQAHMKRHSKLILK